MRKAELIKDKFYFAEYTHTTKGECYILRCPENGRTADYIRLDAPNQRYASGSDFLDNDFREATDREIIWLKECMRQKAFLPQEDVHVQTYEIY